MKIVYFGDGAFGTRCLEYIVNYGNDVVQIYTHPNKGAKNNLIAIAEKHGIPVSVLEANKTNSIKQELEYLAPDLLVAVTWRGLFGKDILAIPEYGAINLHGSLLPANRGNAPTTWAIINDERHTGATVHFIDEGMDTGDIVAQVNVPIEEADTVATLQSKLLEKDGPLLNQAIGMLKDPNFQAQPQDHSKASIGRKRGPEDGLINWNWQSRQIYNWIRAQTRPLPGAFSVLNSGKLVIWASEIATDFYKSAEKAKVGEIFYFKQAESEDKMFPVVRTGQGYIIIRDAEYVTNNEVISLQKTINHALLYIGLVLQ